MTWYWLVRAVRSKTNCIIRFHAMSHHKVCIKSQGCIYYQLKTRTTTYYTKKTWRSDSDYSDKLIIKSRPVAIHSQHPTFQNLLYFHHQGYSQKHQRSIKQHIFFKALYVFHVFIEISTGMSNLFKHDNFL